MLHKQLIIILLLSTILTPIAHAEGTDRIATIILDGACTNLNLRYYQDNWQVRNSVSFSYENIEDYSAWLLCDEAIDKIKTALSSANEQQGRSWLSTATSVDDKIVEVRWATEEPTDEDNPPTQTTSTSTSDSEPYTVTITNPPKTPCTITYQYDASQQKWTYKQGTGSKNTITGFSVPPCTEHQNIFGELMNTGKSEGINYLLGQNIIDPNTRVQTPSTGSSTSGSSGSALKPPADPVTAECGEHGNFVKLCYRWRAERPTSPSSYQTAIRNYVKANPDPDGYVVVAQAAKNEPFPEQLSRSRATLLAKAVTAAQEAVTLRDPNKRIKPVVYDTVFSPSNVEDIVAYTDIYLDTHDDIERYAYAYVMSASDAVDIEVPSSNPYRTMLTRAQKMGADVDDYVDQLLQKLIDESNDLELQGLIKDIKDRFKITVVPIYSVDTIPTRDEASLHQRLADILKEHCKEFTNDDKLCENYVDDETTIRERIRRPCTSYLLIDSQNVDLYHSKYCRLRTRMPSSRLDITTPEQARLLLQSAFTLSRQPEPKTLLLGAHNMVRSVDYVEGGRLAEWVMQEENWGDDERVVASAEIVLADKLIHTRVTEDGSKSDSIEDEVIAAVEKYYGAAYEEFKPIAIDILFKAVLEKRYESFAEQCREVEKLYRHEQWGHTQYRSQYYKEAGEFVRACELQQISTSCAPLGDEEVSFLHTRIVFVNDDLSDTSFDSIATQIKNRLLGMDNLNAHTGDIDVYSTKSTRSLLTAARNEFQRPGTDYRGLQLVKQGCPGDIHIVLSKKLFESSTLAGTGMISLESCENDLRCMNIYTARSIAQTIFKLPPQDRTVTADFTYNPLDTTVYELFSFEQQQLIDEYYEGVHG